MRIPWKIVGLAGLAGVAATGAVVARKHRAQRDYDPAELRARLHTRLAEVPPELAPSAPDAPTGAAPAEPAPDAPTGAAPAEPAP